MITSFFVQSIDPFRASEGRIKVSPVQYLVVLYTQGPHLLHFLTELQRWLAGANGFIIIIMIYDTWLLTVYICFAYRPFFWQKDIIESKKQQMQCLFPCTFYYFHLPLLENSDGRQRSFKNFTENFCLSTFGTMKLPLETHVIWLFPYHPAAWCK